MEAVHGAELPPDLLVPVAVQQGRQRGVQRGQAGHHGGEAQAGGDVEGEDGDHGEDVEGGPGDQEQQEGDRVHLGGPPLLPGYHLAGAGHLPPNSS